MKKPPIDPVTGCAHIMNEVTPLGIYRVCSFCRAGIPDHTSGPNGFGQYIDEGNVEFCYSCGVTFDHTDDEPKEANK